MNKAEEFYQEVKNQFKGNGNSFECYEDAFLFAEAYHQSELKKINKCTCDKCTGRELESLYDDE